MFCVLLSWLIQPSWANDAEEFAELIAEIEAANHSGDNVSITLTEDITLSEALPPIRGTITIEGGGHTISGSGKYRIFDVAGGGQLNVKNLTLIEGNGGREPGGAIRLLKDAQLKVDNVSFRNNRARLGGAIGTRGLRNSLWVKNSRFLGNSAEQGGAITLTIEEAIIENSSFRQNLATNSGGAIATWRGDIDISNSTFLSNVANTGGGVYVDGGIVTLTHLTMLNNAASGGVGAGLRKFKGIIYLRNSIIAGGSGASQCFGRLAQNAGNLIEDGACKPEYGGDPKLDLVVGTSPYYVPRDDSPAINAAYRMFCPAGDQIGRARPQGAGCDIGAVESTSAGATGAGPLLGVCTLQDRIFAANSNRAVGNCPAGTDHDIITITEDITLRVALPPITGTVTIEGGGHTISGDKKFRIFAVAGGNLTVNNLTLTEGFAEGGGGAIQARDGGRLAVNDSRFIKNVSKHGGGAIDMKGEKGFAIRSKGIQGVTYSQGRELTINRSAFIQNRAYNGGALNLYGTTAISDSSFIQNASSLSGGAVAIVGDRIRITNSTFSGNRSDYSGGALHGGHSPGGDITLTHLTMVDNSGARGNEGYAMSWYESATNVRLRNSIIAGGGRDVLCSGRLEENIGNIIEDGSCASMVGGDPMLAEMTGSPAYFPLKDGSPAIDAADAQFCLETDQIGTARPQGGGCDIGAIESGITRRR